MPRAALSALTLVIVSGAGWAQHGSPVPAAAGAPHVMLIVEENRSAPSVIGASDAPYINSLATTYGVATAAYGQAHPSLPNYLELISGSTQGVRDDGTGYSFAGPTLVDQMTQHGISWRAYMESMPATCFSGASAGTYAKKHDPFMYFTSITANAAQCRNVVPFTSLAADLASPQAPDFAWVTPNLCNDGHDCSTATADGWLASNLTAVLSSSWFAEDGIVILTWDEGADSSGCCGSADGGRIVTIVIASAAHAHATLSQPVDHAGTLRTIEDVYGLPPLGDAACTCSGTLAALVPPSPSAAPPGLTWLTAPHWR